MSFKYVLGDTTPMSHDDSATGDDGENAGGHDARTSGSADRRSDIATGKGTDAMDQLIRVLANDRRRFLLATLRESDDGVGCLSELAKAIARRDSEEEGTLDESRLEEVVISLHHVHLPKLQASELVDYDESSGAVRYRGNPAADALVALVADGE